MLERGRAILVILATFGALAAALLRPRSNGERQTTSAATTGDAGNASIQLANLETLDELARAYVWLHHGQQLPDPTLVGEFWQRVRVFAAHSDRSVVIDSYFSPLVPAAVLQVRQQWRGLFGIPMPWGLGFVREEDTLHLVFPTGAPAPLIQLIFQAYGLHAETRQTRVLLPDDSHIVMQLIFTLIRELLQLAGRLSATSPGRPNGALAAAQAVPPTQAAPANGEDYKPYIAVLDRARFAFEGAAQRRAQTQYFWGMIVGIVLPSAAVFGLWRGLAAINMAAPEQDLLVMSLLVGALGAVVSVMQRMTSGNLTLRFRAGRILILLLGGFRPIIGAVFGVLAYVLILVGLLPVRIPETAPVPTALVQSVVPYFLGVAAFFAGFSERFAQDMLATGQDQLSAKTKPSTEAPAAGAGDPATV